MVKKLVNGNLYGKRKFLSAWGVWLIMVAIFFTISLIMALKDDFKFIVQTLELFVNYSIWHWGLYFGANAVSKLTGGKNDK